MTDHKIGTREEWQAPATSWPSSRRSTRSATRRSSQKRRELPWVPVEKEYEFDTEDGKKTLADLFEGRSQLLAYNIMFGPDYEIGACPGCTSLGDDLDGPLRAPGPPRRDADLLLARADRSARRLQAADGLAVPVRLDLRHRLPVRLRARVDRGAGAGDPRDQGDGRRTAGVAAGLVGSRSAPSSRTACARTRAGLRSRARTGPSTTPTRCRRPTRSLLPTLLPARPHAEGRRRNEPRAWRKDEYPD